MNILYIRHGESTANVNGVAGVPSALLTDKGVAQAEQTGEYLKAMTVTTICCSPFVRARQTAEIIAESLDYAVQNIITIDELHERYLGKFEGETGYTPDFFLNADDEGGIESKAQMIERANTAFSKLKAITQEHGGTTLAIAHGQIGYYLTQISQGHKSFENFDSPSEINNAEFTELWRSDDK